MARDKEREEQAYRGGAPLNLGAMASEIDNPGIANVPAQEKPPAEPLPIGTPNNRAYIPGSVGERSQIIRDRARAMLTDRGGVQPAILQQITARVGDKISGYGRPVNDQFAPGNIHDTREIDARMAASNALTASDRLGYAESMAIQQANPPLPRGVPSDGSYAPGGQYNPNLSQVGIIRGPQSAYFPHRDIDPRVGPIRQSTAYFGRRADDTYTAQGEPIAVNTPGGVGGFVASGVEYDPAALSQSFAGGLAEQEKHNQAVELAEKKAGEYGLKNNYIDFMRNEIDNGATKEQALAAWEKVVDTRVEKRYPTRSMATGLPAGITFDRRSGKFFDEGGQEISEDEFAQLRVDAAGAKAESGSLVWQTKNLHAMNSYVNNMDKQIERVGTIAEDLTRSGIRIANVPIRELLTKVKGSALENSVALYVAEISAEAARLANGNPQSIAELSTENRKKWDNIHDLNLPIPELLKLLAETKYAGALRVNSLRDEQVKSRESLKNIRTPARTTPTAAPPSVPGTGDVLTPEQQARKDLGL